MSQNILDYDYQLPEELIASRPLEDRTSSRLLILDRNDGSVEHSQFKNLIDYLSPGDALFLNNTKVIPARIKARRQTGKEIEVLLIRELELGQWQALVSSSGKVKEGEELFVDSSGIKLFVHEPTDMPGIRRVEFTPAEKFWEEIETIGQIPLPPYIERDSETHDEETYQTVFAKERGAVAAPTAGLHFNEALLQQIKEKGISVGTITLHVGYGTFQPLKEEHFQRQALHEEYFSISKETASLFNKTKQEGKKVFVCGTTTLRALESSVNQDGKLKAQHGLTSIFIFPPYDIKTADALITNFHLPQTSLLCLVSAFSSREHLLNAYQSAIQEKYRFYSYGDAMLLK